MEATPHERDERSVDESKTFSKKGGWITFPFITVTILGVGVASAGATSNLVVYLIREYNVKSIDAAQIYNIINGCQNVTPVAGAIVADAFFGCYPVVAASAAISLLSLVMFTLTAGLRSLRPRPCPVDSGIQCQPASAGQLVALYAAVSLLSIGAGGTRFNLATMGASQLDRARDRDTFFNWYFVFLYSSAIAGSTVIVYIQDSLSWTLGFALSTVAGAIGFTALLTGARYYRRTGAHGSPFTSLAQVVVATARKRKVDVRSPAGLRYYNDREDPDGVGSNAPSESFSFLNRAALIRDGEVYPDGTVARPWSLCTVQQVEDFKTILRIVPLWTTSILVSISIGVQLSFTVIQALTMDRSIGHFTVPAASLFVSGLASVIISLALLDRVLLPLWHRLMRHTPTPLQRIGLGHALNIIGMVSSALIERRRIGIVHMHHAEHQPGWIVPMSAMWLVLPFAVVGAGEALHFPGQVTLYYQEFPKSLKNTATGMIALIIALGFYLSTAVVDVVRRVTSWLPDNLNASRLENLYWMMAVLVSINFAYFLLCAKLYKYQNTSSRDAETEAH